MRFLYVLYFCTFFNKDNFWKKYTRCMCVLFKCLWSLDAFVSLESTESGCLDKEENPWKDGLQGCLRFLGISLNALLLSNKLVWYSISGDNSRSKKVICLIKWKWFKKYFKIYTHTHIHIVHFDNLSFLCKTHNFWAEQRGEKFYFLFYLIISSICFQQAGTVFISCPRINFLHFIASFCQPFFQLIPCLRELSIFLPQFRELYRIPIKIKITNIAVPQVQIRSRKQKSKR